MSEKTRRRLGPAGGLVERFITTCESGLSRFLSHCGTADTLAGTLHRADGFCVPVRLSCVARSAHGVLLTADIGERAADRIGGLDQQLFTPQTAVLEKYFRLLRAQQALDSRVQRRSRNPGLVLIEQLERERARLARELHAGAGQSLAAIQVHLDLIEKQEVQLPPEIRRCLDRIGALARQASEEIRAVSRPLHPPDWKANGLAEALQNLWNNSGIAERFQASLTLGRLHPEPHPALRAVIYRVAQEALANAVRHAGAEAISLALEQTNGSLRLTVLDNGSGFDPAAQRSSGGIGLRSMREQVESFGGEVRLSSGAGGTTLEILIPREVHDE